MLLGLLYRIIGDFFSYIGDIGDIGDTIMAGLNQFYFLFKIQMERSDQKGPVE